MILFTCDLCEQQLYFESTECTNCGARLGFLAEKCSISALTPTEVGPAAGSSNTYQVRGPDVASNLVRMCQNGEQYAACNWLVPAQSSEKYCASCALSERIPDLSDDKNQRAWRRLEAAKRRLLFTLYSLGLPVESRAENPDKGLAFHFLQASESEPVTTGHADGVITINVAEADHAFRENERERLGEAYRTMLGHFRHEIGHYYFDRLLAEEAQRAAFRDLFGDERVSYEQAVQRHYEKGPPEAWADGYISGYATMHPWEDWAETWAHYLHMVDTLETAKSYGLAVREPASDGLGKQVVTRAVDDNNFDALMRSFYPVTLALNDLNRSMGLPDAYPFAVSPLAREKLAFVHDLIRQ